MLQLMKLILVVGMIHLSFQQGDQQQHDQTLTRETVDAILQVLSPSCRSETEAALDSQSEISMECKYEIQSSIPNLLTDADQELHRRQQERYEFEMNSRKTDTPKQQRREKRRAREVPEEISKPEGTSPIVLLGGLIATVVIGILGLYFFYQAPKADDSLSPKKQRKMIKKKVR